MNLTKIFWSSKELERGQNKQNDICVGRYQSKYLMLPKIFGIKKHFMFTKNIWHNCAERYAGSRLRPALPVKREGGPFFVRFNESILQRGARHGTLMQCKKRTGLYCGHELYTGGLNHDPWPLIVSQTACTVSPAVYRIVRRESCSAGAQAGADTVHMYCTAVQSRPARTGRGQHCSVVQYKSRWKEWSR